MTGIQSAINQTIGTLGAVGRLSPGYNQKQQAFNLKAQEKTAQEKLKLAQQLPKGKAGAQEKRDIIKQSLDDISNIAQQRFDVAPTAENLNALMSAKKNVSAFNRKETQRLKGNERAKQARFLKQIQSGNVDAIHKALKEGTLNVLE